MQNALKGQNREVLDIFLNFIFLITSKQSKTRNDEMLRISSTRDVTRGAIRFVLLGDTLILTQLFKVTLNDT